MKISDILEETYTALISNKARTSLTVLGIVIGIASVIAMISIGAGAQGTIESSIQSIGSNLITVTPGNQGGIGAQVSSGRGSARTLTEEDALAILEQVDNVKYVSPELSGRYQVIAKGANTNTSVTGVNESYTTVRNIKVAEGEFISTQHLRNYSRVAVLGPTTRDDLFGENTYAIGQNIRINNTQFKVIGITESKGGSGFTNPDDAIYIPLSSAQRFLTGSTHVSSIGVQASDAESMTQVQNDLTLLLLNRHKISDPELADFSTLNQADILATASSITDTFTIFLGSVAGISLVVGGIGIMNMMLTTVTERTREIGLRKAIGAKAKDINLQFLAEAVMLTFAGGVIGVILGWAISFGVTYFDILQTKVTIQSVLLAFSISTAIGIIFGYYPAQRASKLNPIEALRYE
ncbi:MAG: FtsX-like permease family protein [Parcubacteria group bacterium]|jgi:putative ABC transport system permease protein|nr:FtsX-like permease family protein [Parcubacteria group bacterium]